MRGSAEFMFKYGALAACSSLSHTYTHWRTAYARLTDCEPRAKIALCIVSTANALYISTVVQELVINNNNDYHDQTQAITFASINSLAAFR